MKASNNRLLGRLKVLLSRKGTLHGQAHPPQLWIEGKPGIALVMDGSGGIAVDCFLASDRAGFISGQKLDVDGGFGG